MNQLEAMIFFSKLHLFKKTSLSNSKNAECPPIARCSKIFNEILVPTLEQMDNNQKIGLNFQTADAILPQNNTYLPHNPICQI